MHAATRLLLHLSAVLLLTAGLTGCSREAKTARHLDKGQQYFEAGQYDRAELELRNVLQADPGNAAAICQLGLIYFDQGRIARAAPLLRKGTELQPDNLDVRLKLGSLFAASGQREEAIAAATFVLERRPSDAQAPLLLAEASTKPEEIAAARGLLDGLVSAGSDTSSVHVARGVLALRENDTGSARSEFERAREMDPRNAAAHASLGALFMAEKDSARAEEAFKTAAELSPPRSPRRLLYARLKIQQGDLETAKHLLDSITLETPDYLPAWMALAEIAASEKDYDRSAELLGRVLAEDPLTPEAMLLAARVSLAKGDAPTAIAQLEKMASMYPRLPQVHVQMAQAHVANNDPAKAIASLNQAMALAPDSPEISLLLAGLHVRTGDVSSAIVILRQVVEKRPELGQARLMLAEAYRIQGNFDDALAVYRALETANPKNPQVVHLTGLVLAQQQKPAEARLAFSRVLELAPDFLPAVEQLVNLDLAAGDFPVALARVQERVTGSPDNAVLHLLLARVFLAQKDNSRAEGALRRSIELQADQRTAYFLLARLYVDERRHEEALANLRDIIEKNPKDVGALMLQGMIHHEQKDFAAARASYEQLLAANPRFSPALNNLAYLYSEEFGELDKAFELAKQARELLPYDPHTADTLGWIVFQRRQYSWALNLLEESARKLPTAAEVQFHLGMVQYMMGREESARAALEQALQLDGAFPGADEARQRIAILAIAGASAGPEEAQVLERRLRDEPDDPIALVRMAAIREREGAVDAALASYEKALAANPQSVAVLLAMARLHETRRNDTAKALAVVKEARKIAPENPQVAHELGRLAFATGDFPWAASLLQEAARRLPGDSAVLFDQAQAAYSIGRTAVAENALREALRIDPAFPRSDEARRILEFIALASGREIDAAAEARATAALEADPTFVPALMVLAAAKERQGDAGAARTACEKALSRYPGFVPAMRSLALLLSEDPAETDRTYDLAVKAREAFPDDPDLALVAGAALCRRGDLRQAAGLLTAGVAKKPGDAKGHFYLGLTQHGLGQAVEGRASLQRALDLGLAGPLADEARRTLAANP